MCLFLLLVLGCVRFLCVLLSGPMCFNFGCPSVRTQFVLTVEWQHRLLAALEVGYFERQQHQELQWCPISQILTSSAIITWLERGTQGRLDSHHVARVVRSIILHLPYQGLRVWDRDEQDLFVMFKPEELPRKPFAISSIPQGAQKAVWKARKFFREERYGFLEVPHSRDFLSRTCAYLDPSQVPGRVRGMVHARQARGFCRSHGFPVQRVRSSHPSPQSSRSPIALQQKRQLHSLIQFV